MKIGIRLHDTIQGTLQERLAFTKGQGFSCAHLALSKVIDGFKMADAPNRLAEADFAREIGGAFAQTGMGCAVLGCYLCLADPDDENRARTQEIYRAHLSFAGKIGAAVVGTETPASPDARFAADAPQSEEAFRFFLGALKPVVRAAEETGAILAIEPVWRHIVSTPEKAERMLEEMKSDHLRIILDAVNLLGPETVAQADRIVEDAIRRLGDRVSVLHMKDYRIADGEKEDIACGDGSMRYERLLRFAKEKDLPMTLENTCPENAEGARLLLEKIAQTV